ncbi:MAG: arginine--tRNA ligase [Rickettsiales bacterium]|nr:arginine--tRNA ligase [Rickettsiales bacterium]
MNIFKYYKEIFSTAILDIAKENNIAINNINKLSVEPSKDEKNGDIACNAAMVFLGDFKTVEGLNNPRKFAELILSKIDDPYILKTEIAGPGFINIFLKDKIYQEIVGDLINNEFSFPNIGDGEKVNLEYASPNPTGPIHVGHTRGSIYGDVLAKLLSKTGYDVLKEYYINDAGEQINILLRSALLRYKQACNEKVGIPEGLYPGEYLIEIGKKIKTKFGETLLTKQQDEALVTIRDFVIREMVEVIKKDLLELGIKHDSYFYEKENLHDNNKIKDAIDRLKAKDLIYVGKLELPKTKKGVGANKPEGYDEKDQTLFRSTKFGDDQDRVVIKSDGKYTYFAGDLAYILSKFERGATKFIMPLGFDHSGYVKRLSAAVKALTNDKAQLKVILCQLVKFVKDGQPLKMSKRAGNFITAKEVIDEVGADVLRFLMLTRKNDAPFDFDLAKVIEQSKDNPIFYVQYAHARCCSILRNLKEEGIDYPDKASFKELSHLNKRDEISLIKKIANFERTIEMAAVNFEPHRIAFYLQDLASSLHSLWNKGLEDPDLRFIIKGDLEKSQAKAYLAIATKKVIKIGLDIFNIKALDEMR